MDWIVRFDDIMNTKECGSLYATATTLRLVNVNKINTEKNLPHADF